MICLPPANRLGKDWSERWRRGGQAALLPPFASHRRSKVRNLEEQTTQLMSADFDLAEHCPMTYWWPLLCEEMRCQEMGYENPHWLPAHFIHRFHGRLAFARILEVTDRAWRTQTEHEAPWNIFRSSKPFNQMASPSTHAQKGNRLMESEQDQARRLAYLEAKVFWLESLLEQWIVTETTSMMNIDKWTAQAAVLQELRRSPESQARNAQAIRAAWQAGDKKRAIELYSSVYQVDEKTAKATLESTPGL